MLTVECARPADFDGDGYVDVTDLLTLIGGWGTAAGSASYDPACDINRDSAVDTADLLDMIADFGS